MIQLLALDIDNTLTGEDGAVSESTIASVRHAQSQGVQVVLVSARPPQGVAHVAQALGKGVYCVSCFGAVVHDPQGNELQRLTLDMEVARGIARFADEHEFSITLNVSDVEYQTQQQGRACAGAREVVATALEVLDAGVPPVLISFEGHAAASAFDEYCSQQCADRVSLARHFNPDGSYLSALVVHPQARKGHALEEVRNLLSIEKGGVLAIGDSESDISMFEMAGLGVAVQNASADARESARIVTPMPYGKGVEWALQVFV
jgi:hypothetical protein